VALAGAQTDQPSQQLGQQWSVKVEEDDDELAIFAGRTRFVSVKRPPGLPADHSDSPPHTGNTYPQTSSFEKSTEQVCRPESSTDWAHSTSHRDGRYDMHHPNAPTTGSTVPTQLWRPPHSSDYSYVPQHHVSCPTASQPHPAQQTPVPVIGSSTHSWAPTRETTRQYRQAAFTTSMPQMPVFNQYNPPSAASYHGHLTRPPPAELADLGLVAQDSRLDERWTSFMRDSGYFEEVGYRTR